MGLYLGGLIIGRIFASEIWWAYFREGLVFGRAYYRNFTVCDYHFIILIIRLRGRVSYEEIVNDRGAAEFTILYPRHNDEEQPIGFVYTPLTPRWMSTFAREVSLIKID